ncbi:copper resistance CopC family protein [Methylococcus sp. ANG]|uniref:copper resistance CopC family protein n=1 Tax=unclassified Methylococcus TaxID=2618889 RepID=UPI001C53043B|nr:copper resistance CopC family protein [Methylococcus sp. Mc7]QXP82792.1 copper resistance protein CopC [Methylococcus sp. Mc7]
MSLHAIKPFGKPLRIIALSLLALSSEAWSHAVVTESSLTSHPVKPNQPTKVVLFFNSGVELALSRVFLVSKGDVFHPVNIAKGKKAGEMLVDIPPLEPGDYALKYKVFAADGHFTENVIRFRVDNP